MCNGYNKGMMSTKSGQWFLLGRGRGRCKKGVARSAQGLPEVPAKFSSAWWWVPMSSFHFFKLYIIYTHLFYIFEFRQFFLKPWAETQTHFLQNNSPTFFNNHFILPVKTPTCSLTLFLSKGGKREICHTAPP